MRLTEAMSDKCPLHFPIAPIFSVTEKTVSVEKVQIPYWKDSFAACFMFDLQYMGAGPFRDGLWAIEKALMSRPSDPLVKTPLYGQLLHAQDYQLNEKETIIYACKDEPVGDFIEKMANRARFQNRVPATYSELKKDLSGERKSVL